MGFGEGNRAATGLATEVDDVVAVGSVMGIAMGIVGTLVNLAGW